MSHLLTVHKWIWPVPIIIGVLFAPESPWYDFNISNLEQPLRRTGGSSVAAGSKMLRKLYEL
jgi:hypothetical protein